MRYLTTVLMLLLGLVMASFAGAASPMYVNYQGVLVDGGSPIPDATYSLTFEIYDDESSGTLLWGGDYDVEVSGGIFSVYLGTDIYPIDPSIFSAYPTWIEVTVNDLTLTFPRQIISFSAYATHAIDAESADVSRDLTCVGCVNATDLAANSVGTSEVAFNYAASTTEGGAAIDLSCNGCISTTQLGANSVSSSELAANSVGTSEVAFNYAGSTTEGGAANNLVCTGCVNESDLGLPLSVVYSDTNGGVISSENISNGSPGNYPAGLLGESSGSAGSYYTIGVMGLNPPLGSGSPVGNLPNGAIGTAGVSTSGPGVAGASTNDNGVHGVSSSTSSLEAGVFGESSNTACGVRGESSGGHGTYGVTTSSGDSGVRGYTSTSGAYALSAYNSTSGGLTAHIQATSGSSIYAFNYGTSLSNATIRAYNSGGISIWGQSNSTDTAAAFSNNSTGPLIKGFGGDGGEHEFIVDNDGSVWSDNSITADGDVSGNRVFSGSSAPTAVYNGYTYSTATNDVGSSDDVIVDDDIIVGGSVYVDGTVYGGKGSMATVFTDKDGVNRTYHTEESTQAMITDRGMGQMKGGQATIFMDPVFADAIEVDQTHKMMVQLTPTSDCMGLFVVSTTGNSFTVRELNGGTSDATFDWEVAGYQKGGLDGRMPRLSSMTVPVSED